MEIFDLVNQVTVIGGVFGGETGSDGSLHAVGSEVEDLADFTILDPGIEFPAGLTVSAHESDPDLEVFLLRFFIQFEHLAGRESIRRDRLFHEDV